MIRRWLALTYYLYVLRLAALSHFYFNPLYFKSTSAIPKIGGLKPILSAGKGLYENKAYIFQVARTY